MKLGLVAARLAPLAWTSLRFFKKVRRVALAEILLLVRIVKTKAVHQPLRGWLTG